MKNFFYLLLLVGIWGDCFAQPDCENTEPFFGGGRIREFCVFPEFPNEDSPVFARFVVFDATPEDFSELEFEVDGNIVRLAGPLNIAQTGPVGGVAVVLVPLGTFPQGEYVLEFYADLDLNLISGGGIVSPNATRGFTVGPAPIPEPVPALHWWAMLLLICGLLLLAARTMSSPENLNRR